MPQHVVVGRTRRTPGPRPIKWVVGRIRSFGLGTLLSGLGRMTQWCPGPSGIGIWYLVEPILQDLLGLMVGPSHWAVVSRTPSPGFIARVGCGLGTSRRRTWSPGPSELGSRTLSPGWVGHN